MRIPALSLVNLTDGSCHLMSGWCGDKGSCPPLFSSCLHVLTVINQFIYESVWHVKKNIELFTSRQEIKGLGLRGRNNLNTPRCRLLKTQGNFPLQALKLVNRLPQDVAVLSLKRFESRVGQWLGIKLFYSLSSTILSFHFIFYFIYFSLIAHYLTLFFVKQSIQNWSTT